MRQRIAIVVQRYGDAITGGAEAHARAIALQLAARYDVEVLTTCALDNRHWDHAFEPGRSLDGTVSVIRFAQQSRGNFWARRTPIGVRRLAAKAAAGSLQAPYVGQNEINAVTRAQEMKWLAAQGPACEALIAHLLTQLPNYRAVIVYSLRYWTAVAATLAAGEKVLLVPTLHDEKAMYRTIFRDVLVKASTVFFNATAEQSLADRLYGRCYRRADLLGIGVNAQLPETHVRTRVKQKLGVSSPYVIYTGRINPAKGCDVLLRAFERFRGQTNASVQLVLLGRIEMALPAREWLVAPGFVSDEDRDALLADSIALALPSRFESLSLSTLEAMAFGVPTIVNGECDVLAHHIAQSESGYTFHGVDALTQAFAQVCVLSADARAQMSQRAQRYVQQNYSWPRVLERIENAIAAVEHGDAK